MRDRSDVRKKKKKTEVYFPPACTLLLDDAGYTRLAVKFTIISCTQSGSGVTMIRHLQRPNVAVVV